MKIDEALKIIQNYPSPLTLTISASDDGMIDGTITSIGDPMTEITSHYGPGSIEGAIIGMAKDLPITEVKE